MISLIERNLNIHQFLKENINNYKEAFIEYYGEENIRYDRCAQGCLPV